MGEVRYAYNVFIGKSRGKENKVGWEDFFN
jgi:hypothetical protein